MAAFERTHLLRHDFDWLPPSFRALRWAMVGAASIVGVGTTLLLPSSGPFLLKFLGPSIATSAYFGSGYATTSFLRQRLRKLARGELELQQLKQQPDGQLVHLSGRVRVRETIPSLLDKGPGVYRRLIWATAAWTSIGQVSLAPLVHETAVDFSLADEHGELVHLDVTGARLITTSPSYQTLYAGPAFDRIWELPLPPQQTRQSQLGKKRPRINVEETVIVDGDLVDVLGYKSRVVDPTVERMERETPLRATVKGGSQFPLLLARRNW